MPATRPFRFYAHGYGFFTGDDPSDLCLHVPVLRNADLDSFQEALCRALTSAGGVIANWSAADLWSPHITLLDRYLNAEQLGAAAAALARRHHPSWNFVADRVLLTGGWRDHDGSADLVLMGSIATRRPDQPQAPADPWSCVRRGQWPHSNANGP